ncbi:hypothetical protein AB0G74_31700 [Streptomyces sp. NPDC020875]|uniref:hypothetical protein n=1 Tax=Streptomyces sp. NPDC020875 TaxID=3154898 RepID=UPI0033EA5999
MRRLPIVLGTLAAAASLAVGVPSATSPARAGTGELIVNGTVHHDPSGCFTSARRPLVVENRTNNYVFVHDRAGCGGPTIGIVRPDQRSTWPLGISVSTQ